MQYSKRQLERAGEPLGECVTRPKLGGGYVCGGGGGGGSSSSSTTTQNIDKRIAVGDGGIGASADNSTVTINSTDGGLVARALDSVDRGNAINGEGFTALLDASSSNFEQVVGANSDGFSQLIDTASRLFTQGENLIGQTQKSVADAYSQAQNEKAGTIDNKTIIVLAVAGAAALVLSKRKG